MELVQIYFINSWNYDYYLTISLHFLFFSLIFPSWIRIHSPDDDDYGTLARARFLDLRCIFLASVASLVGL